MLSTEASGCRESGPGRLASSPRVLPLRRIQGGVGLGPWRRVSESARGPKQFQSAASVVSLARHKRS